LNKATYINFQHFITSINCVINYTLVDNKAVYINDKYYIAYTVAYKLHTLWSWASVQSI